MISFDSMFGETWQAHRHEDHDPRTNLREAEVISVFDNASGAELIVFGKAHLRRKVKRAKGPDDVIPVKWLKISLDFNSHEFPALLMLVSTLRGGHDVSRNMLAAICEAMA